MHRKQSRFRKKNIVQAIATTHPNHQISHQFNFPFSHYELSKFPYQLSFLGELIGA
jgi:hypothetical protein